MSRLPSEPAGKVAKDDVTIGHRRAATARWMALPSVRRSPTPTHGTAATTKSSNTNLPTVQPKIRLKHTNREALCTSTQRTDVAQ
jgi:hypothetical protein